MNQKTKNILLIVAVLLGCAAAQAQGYRSRAAFKLIEMDDRYGLIKPGCLVVDLGAAPGGWAQVAVKRGAAKVLGLDLDRAPAEETLSPELTTLVEERRQARKNKDFKRSDELRKELLEKGVLVEDTPKGMTWKKKGRVVRD